MNPLSVVVKGSGSFVTHISKKKKRTLISQLTWELLKMNPCRKPPEPITHLTSLSCCVTVAVQKQDTETGISDYTAFPSALRDEYFMRDRRRLGAPLNMWHTLVSCVELCVFRRWLSEEKRELVWEMGPVRKAQSKACCLMKQTLNPYKLSVHCLFNVTYSLLKKGERRNILLTNFWLL